MIGVKVCICIAFVSSSFFANGGAKWSVDALSQRPRERNAMPGYRYDGSFNRKVSLGNRFRTVPRPYNYAQRNTYARNTQISSSKQAPVSYAQPDSSFPSPYYPASSVAAPPGNWAKTNRFAERQRPDVPLSPPEISGERPVPPPPVEEVADGPFHTRALYNDDPAIYPPPPFPGLSQYPDQEIFYDEFEGEHPVRDWYLPASFFPRAPVIDEEFNNWEFRRLPSPPSQPAFGGHGDLWAIGYYDTMPPPPVCPCAEDSFFFEDY